MREELISAEYARTTFDYNEETGVLVWVAPTNRRILKGSAVGSVRDDGYLEVQVNGARVRVHRLIWLIVHGVWPKNDIDHINGKRDDNRICNLRDVSRQENVQNQRNARKGTVSGKLGVSWNKNDGKWHAKIGVNGVCRYLGSFVTPEEAHEAYIAAKRVLHSGCTI